MTIPNPEPGRALRAPPPARPGTSEIRYRIDRDDRIVAVGKAWADFARDNDAPELDATLVVGSPLWDFIRGEEVRSLYRQLFASARAAGRALEIPFRCDSPVRVRRMVMLLSPEPGGELEIRCRLVEEAARPYTPVLDVRAPRTEDFLALCSWCAAARLDRFPGVPWVALEVAVEELELLDGRPAPRLTHGICPQCVEEMEARL